jgi:6-pyruvoyl-tetrahydropterin synthase related domain
MIDVTRQQFPRTSNATLLSFPIAAAMRLANTDRQPASGSDAPLHVAMLVLFGGFLTLPALWNGYLPSRDVLIHLLWSSNFSDQLWAGDLYPRWLDGMNAGLGSPAFFFYGPLPYYVAALLRPLVGPDAEGWRQITMAAALAVIVSGVITYAWLRTWTSETAAVAAALVYMSSPYHLAFDLYQRFAFGELWAFAWMPLIMLMAQRLREARPGAVIGLALAYAALLLSHLPTAVIFTPVVLVYLALGSKRGQRLRRAHNSIAALALGFGLAAIYLVPALATQSHVSFDAMKAGYFFYGYNFLYQGPRFNADFDALVRAQGWFASAMLGLSVIAIALAWRPMGGRLRQSALFWLFVAVGAWLMMIPPAKRLWDLLPPLQAIQFPWRFNVVLTIAMTALVALWSHSLSVRPSKLQVVLVVAASVTIIGQSVPTVVNYLAMAAAGGTPTIDKMLMHLGPLNPDARDKFEAAKLSIDVPEYRPRWVPAELLTSAGTLQAFLAAPAVRGTIDARPGACEGRRCRRFTTDPERPGWITIRQFFYPGWEARVAGHQAVLPVRPSAEGLLQVLAPAGSNAITILLAPRHAELAGRTISLISVIGAAGVMVGLRRKRVARQAV